MIEDAAHGKYNKKEIKLQEIEIMMALEYKLLNKSIYESLLLTLKKYFFEISNLIKID